MTIVRHVVSLGSDNLVIFDKKHRSRVVLGHILIKLFFKSILMDGFTLLRQWRILNIVDTIA
ncbi:hypothetical protein D1872_348370 [compost metagenome]